MVGAEEDLDKFQKEHLKNTARHADHEERQRSPVKRDGRRRRFGGGWRRRNANQHDCADQIHARHHEQRRPDTEVAQKYEFKNGNAERGTQVVEAVDPVEPRLRERAFRAPAHIGGKERNAGSNQGGRNHQNGEYGEHEQGGSPGDVGVDPCEQVVAAKQETEGKCCRIGANG